MSEKQNDDRYEEGCDWSRLELGSFPMIPLGKWKWIAIGGSIVSVLGLILQSGYLLLLGIAACAVVAMRQMLSMMPPKEYLHRSWAKDSYKLPKRIPIKMLSWLRWVFLVLFIATLAFLIATANLWLVVLIIVFFVLFGLSNGDVTIAMARKEIDESGEAPEVRKRFCICGNPLIPSPIEGWLDCEDERCAEMYQTERE